MGEFLYKGKINKRRVKMKRISDKALTTYEYILKRFSDGIIPTVREICNDLGYKSTSTAHKILIELEEAGYISRENGLNRNIKVNVEKVLQVPVVGSVAAGEPITAIQNIEGYIPFKARGYGYGDLFALNVKGESMVEIGILDGDIVVAKQTSYAYDGEIVVAMIDEEATVKRFYKKDGRFMLKAENKNFSPIIVDEVTILGKVISCIRSYE